MLKKILLSIILIISLKGLGFCANEIYQNTGDYYGIANTTSTPSAVVISSTTVTTFTGINAGVNRVFHIVGTPTAVLYFQLGGNSATVITKGMVLDNGVYYVEDTYFGDIYFQSTGGSVNLRAFTLIKNT